MNKLAKMQLVNKTGGKSNPVELQKTIDGAEKYSPGSPGDATTLNTIRSEYADSVDMLGSVPPPASLKQGVSNFAKLIQGKDMTVLVDKLSERICFELTGTRLYDAFLAKCQEADSLPGDMTVEQVEHLREEEHQHFLMLKDIVEQLGGDPTAVTPAANASATATGGLCKVVTDPRTTVLQALDAMLIAELTDNDGWSLLIDICDEMGLSEISEQFEKALREEDEHLEYIREWIGAGLLTNASLLSRAERAIRNLGKNRDDDLEDGDRAARSRSSMKNSEKNSEKKSEKNAEKKFEKKSAKKPSKTDSKPKSKTKSDSGSSKKSSQKKTATSKTKSKVAAKASAKPKKTATKPKAKKKSQESGSKTQARKSTKGKTGAAGKKKSK